ncbi:DUF1146 family protein [Paenibacillus thermoaerophilus]|uniref:DUF1146 family protein n=1 Tax=Paenibacillus thermoaerophilus TaxID=1215385 RepID=A0ABW2V6X1_9BACL|nr:DUF1146 family protein [Paenibacillus thermoaerophilus]
MSVDTALDLMERQASVAGLVQIIFILAGIVAAWFALQQVRWDVFLKRPNHPLSKLLLILLSIVIGYNAARFLIDYMALTTVLRSLF